MDNIPARKDIEEKYKWAIEDMLESDDAWEKLYKEVDKAVPELLKFKGEISRSGDSLLAFLKKLYKLEEKAERLVVYSKMKKDEDNDVPKYQDMFMRAASLNMKFSATVSFFAPELLASDEKTILGFIDNTKGLEKYDFVIKEILRERPHTLSAAEEEIIAKASQALESSHETYIQLTNTELQFPKITVDGKKVQISDENFVSFLRSEDRNVRRTAFKAMFETYGKNKNAISSCFIGNLKTTAFYADVGKYENARELYLFGDDVPGSVYDNLLKTIDDNLEVLGDYLKLRKRILKVKDLHMYDLYVPIAENDGKKYTFEEAREIVLKALEPMGEEYVKIAREGLYSRWADVCENKGKTSGAYSWGCYGCHPFMLLNWQGTINDVFTLIHELGHSMHTYYSDKNQPYHYAQYAIFAAEVASTVNENLLIRYLLGQPGANKPYLINHFLEEFRTTIFRQAMFAEFEYKAHSLFGANGAVTGEELSKLYYDINKKYYGKQVKVDELIANEWMRIPHFYTPFYVYKYATGFSCAVAFSKMILEGKKDGYMRFLKSGGSDHPLNLLKRAGVDMNTPAPIESAMQEFGMYVRELEKLI